MSSAVSVPFPKLALAAICTFFVLLCLLNFRSISPAPNSEQTRGGYAGRSSGGFAAKIGITAPTSAQHQSSMAYDRMPNIEAAAGFAGDAAIGAVRDSVSADEIPMNAPSSSGGGERMVVKTARLGVVVDDVALRKAQLVKSVTDQGGYIVSSTQYHATNLDLDIRIPSSIFESFLAQTRSIDGLLELTSESITGTDVTEQYVDVSARVRNADATREQVLKLLEKAGTVKEALEVQMALDGLTERKEVYAAQQQALQRSTAMSAVSVSMQQRVETEQVPRIWDNLQPVRYAQQALQVVALVAIQTVNIAVYLLVLGVPVSVCTWCLVSIVRRFCGERLAQVMHSAA